MKKLLLSFFALGALSASAQHLYGDLDHDGVITVADEIILRNIILGNVEAEEIIPDIFEPFGIHKGHEYVDLGLTTEDGKPIYWATCNVGAENPEDAGLYFAWGETQGYGQDVDDGRYFYWETYLWCDGEEFTLQKYCNSPYLGIVDKKESLDIEDDAANKNWGRQLANANIPRTGCTIQ